jgi:hypothetical protein
LENDVKLPRLEFQGYCKVGKKRERGIPAIYGCGKFAGYRV